MEAGATGGGTGSHGLVRSWISSDSDGGTDKAWGDLCLKFEF